MKDRKGILFSSWRCGWRRNLNFDAPSSDSHLVPPATDSSQIYPLRETDTDSDGSTVSSRNLRPLWSPAFSFFFTIYGRWPVLSRRCCVTVSSRSIPRLSFPHFYVRLNQGGGLLGWEKVWLH
ncbi:hypothetical protein SDJN02_26637, partial [Cucurbita argyrosperma subsp. argyrosperma]